MSVSSVHQPSDLHPASLEHVDGAHPELDRLRNVGIIAHIDAGKTTVTERILYLTGRIHRTGEVHDGQATMDYLPEERERGITITSAATSCEWQKYRLNLIDTPGHVDFTAEVERSLRVLDGAVGIFCGVAGVEAQSETVWRQATRYSVPRIAFINKLDRNGADFAAVIESIQGKLNTCAVPIQWPIVKDGDVAGLIDLVEMVYYRFEDGEKDTVFHQETIPAVHLELAEVKRNKLLESAADFSDELMDRYLEGEEVEPALIHFALREGTLSGGIVPVLGGSALKHRGIHQLLGAICLYLPSPRNKPIVEGRRPGDEEHLIHIDAKKENSLCCLAFKTIADRNGDLTFVRVYSGVLHRGEQVWNPRIKKKERIGRLFRMHADSREPVETAEAGDIVATIGTKETVTGDTLCHRDEPIVLEAISFPETVVSMSIEPHSRTDRDRLSETLARLVKEDPTFNYHTDEETLEMIISGMGELHLEVIKDRLTREYKLNVVVGRPEVAYKQTLKQEVEVESRHIKQTGGHGQYAVVEMRIGPLSEDEKEDGGTFVFKESIVGGSVPREYFRPVESAVRNSMQKGGSLRFPFVGIKAELFDGAYHEVDSSELAFELAARQAFNMAVRQAGTILMEPIVSFEIQAPDEYLGDVLDDLNTRRSQITSMELERGVRVLKGIVPLAETFRYATQLRSLTQGRGSYSFEPCRYSAVPQNIAEKVAKERRVRLETK